MVGDSFTWGNAVAGNANHGADITDRLERLSTVSAAATPAGRGTDSSDPSQLIAWKNSLLASERRRRDALVQDLRWAEENMNGLEKALDLIGRDDGGSGGATSRFETRLEKQRSRASEATAEIQTVDERIAGLEKELDPLRKKMVSHRDQLLKAAEEQKRRAAIVRLQRDRAAPRQLEANTMWSPTAIPGYRIWTIRGGKLRGAREAWTSLHKTASCPLGDGVPHTDGRCAKVAFGCGIYAAKSVSELLLKHLRSPSDRYVVGLVGMGGRVVEHERGYRAERATILALAVIDAGAGAPVWLISDALDLQAFVRSPDQYAPIGAVRYQSPTPGRLKNQEVIDFLEDQERRKTTWT